MKTLFGILVGLFVCASVQAQAPFRRNYYTTNASPAGSINWVDVSTNSYTLGNVGIGTTPITAQKMTLRVDNLTTSPINGLFLTNATPATAGVQVQYSPAIYQSGGAWLTGSLSNAPVSFRSVVIPVVGASTPVARFYLQASVNNGAFSSPFYVDDSGNGTYGNNVNAVSFLASQIVRTSPGLGFEFGTGNSRLLSSADGAIEANNRANSARSTIQANIPQVTKTSNYPVVVLDSGLRFNNIGAVGTVTFTLPTAAAGLHYWFHADATQTLNVTAGGSDQIKWGSILSATGGTIFTAQTGGVIHLFSPKANLWVVDSVSGAWAMSAYRLGNSTLIAGTLTIANSSVTANTAVFLTRKAAGGTIGMSVTYTLNPGTSFTITSDNVLDTSTYTWKLEEIPN